MNISENNEEQAARFVSMEDKDEFWESSWMTEVNHTDPKMLVSKLVIGNWCSE